MEENRIPKKILYMNFGTKRLRGRRRNRWQDEVREDGRIVVGEGWQKMYITERHEISSREWQGIVAFCTCQWNEWIVRSTETETKCNRAYLKCLDKVRE
jgi:hypothetical protein